MSRRMSCASHCWGDSCPNGACTCRCHVLPHDARTEHQSPEQSPALLQAEIDAYRQEIARLRRIAEAGDVLAIMAAATLVMLANRPNTRKALDDAIEGYLSACGYVALVELGARRG